MFPCRVELGGREETGKAAGQEECGIQEKRERRKGKLNWGMSRGKGFGGAKKTGKND